MQGDAPVEIASRRTQIGVDDDRLTYQMGRRSINAEMLAARAGIAPAMLSRIRHGRGCSASTMRRIADALLSFPVHAGADALIVRPADDRGDAA